MKIKYSFFLLLACIPTCLIKAQDTLLIGEIRISTSILKQHLLRSTEAASIIDSSRLRNAAVFSLVAAMNEVPGVRMEERSPGSYRLSLRGSLLRSPFGIRNVKVYLDEFPLTDAGGNTYLNVVAMNAIHSIEIFKGPDGSLFGANSGGVLNIQTLGDKEGTSLELAGGSYGMFKQNLNACERISNHLLQVTESYQRSDGYREHSKLHRLYLQLADDWNYSKKSSLKLSVFYSDLYYQTPGGLTFTQFEANPAQARPSTTVIPGPVVQQAAVYNKMLFAGISHHVVISKYIENTTALFTTSVNFINPFITDYETRNEDTYGARTFFSFSNKPAMTNNLKWDYTLGAEWQQTRSVLANYLNNRGNKGSLTASGNIKSDQHFIFNRLQIDFQKKLIIEAGLSINYYSYQFRDSAKLKSDFRPTWMPRVGINYLPFKMVSLRVTLSRGYSTPTTAEIRPSDNNIYTNLQAETGINLELGLRYAPASDKLWIDFSVFNYQLKNAIVRQENAAGQEFFVNAGGTRQKGLELQSSWNVVKYKEKKFIRKVIIKNSTTLNDFTFRSYINGNVNYSGNRLTGVPVCTIVNSLVAETALDSRLSIQHNYTSSLPLDDGNHFYAHPYNILQIKLEQSFHLHSCKISVYAGVDNFLNQSYSLGNDLNAVGNRFYNAAAGRNFFAGIVIGK